MEKFFSLFDMYRIMDGSGGVVYAVHICGLHIVLFASVPMFFMITVFMKIKLLFKSKLNEALDPGAPGEYVAWRPIETKSFWGFITMALLVLFIGSNIWTIIATILLNIFVINNESRSVQYLQEAI